MKNSSNVFAVIFCTVVLGMASFELYMQHPVANITRLMITLIMIVIETAMLFGILISSEGKTQKAVEKTIWVCFIAAIVIVAVSTENPIVLSALQGMISIPLCLAILPLINLLHSHKS